eukprot:338965-Karenia_brevis.AAC.1
MEHQIIIHQGKLHCHRCGQHWLARRQMVGTEKCPGPQLWGRPQFHRPWIIPPGRDIQWGNYR